MGVYTTLGQFVEFGRSILKPNFCWEFYYNLKIFDGFIVGWTNQNINYLGSLSVEVNFSLMIENKYKEL